jgi:hypothetical protein
MTRDGKECKNGKNKEKERKEKVKIIQCAYTHTYFNLSSFSGRTISSASMKCGTNT